MFTKRVTRRRMKDIGEEVGTKAYTFGKAIKCRLKWAENVFKMKDEILPYRSETKKPERCRIRGRTHLKWEDRLKRDRRKA